MRPDRGRRAALTIHPAPVSVLLRVDPVARIVYTTLYGEITLDDLRQLRQELRRDPSFRPDHDELLDATAVTAVSVAAEAMRELAWSPLFGAGARRALIAPTDLAFGLARMYQQLHRGEARIEAFRTRAEAMAWLGLPR